jgi:hypothetical protein
MSSQGSKRCVARNHNAHWLSCESCQLAAEGMNMKINSKVFQVRPGEKVNLNKWPTLVKPFCKAKEQYQRVLEEHVEELSSLQQLHYASNRAVCRNEGGSGSMIYLMSSSRIAVNSRRRFVGSSVVDLLIASTLAICGIAMSPLPTVLVGGALVAAAAFAFVVDFAKVPLFKRLGIA